MYFVTGGAFNGKSKWVKTFNGLTADNCCWYSAYHQDSFPYYFESGTKGETHLSLINGGSFSHHFERVTKDLVVFEGIEQWIREWLKNFKAEEVQEKWRSVLNSLESWENQKEKRKVIFIGTDITKGIVPINSEDRIWRDVSGRVFQDTAAQCEHVEWIWYGMNSRLK